jgi:oxygen-dependent protoporphyrinogen oxidase
VKVVIVGAGISGLGTAWRLQQLLPRVEVVVLEQAGRPGGTIWTEDHDGFRFEHGANGFLDTQPATVQLCRQLGLGERLVPASEAAARNRYLFLDGQLKLLPNSLVSFLRSDLLSWRGKLSLLAERFRPARRQEGDESVADFTRRRAGAEALLLADAAVTGIHAGDPEALSMQSAFPRLAELERRYGSVLRGLGQSARQRRHQVAAGGQPDERPGRMWSFREGLRLLIETLQARLVRPPLLGAGVRRLERPGSGQWLVRGDGRDQWQADAVVLACPAYQQAGILADLDPELADRIAGIAYNRIAVVALGYRQADVPFPLDGFGFIAPQATRRDLLGVQWCSSIYPERAPPGGVLLRALCGGWHRADVAAWDDDRLLAAVRAELRLAMRLQAEPVFHRIVRWPRAIPQYHLGHRQRVTWIEQRAATHAGLFLTGNAYHGVALNDCTQQAEIVACRVKDYLTGGADC